MSTPAFVRPGRYEYRTDAHSLEQIGDLACFYPSKKTAHLLPRSSTDGRLPWFCFTNTDFAAEALGIKTNNTESGCGVTGPAIVEVQGYQVYSGEGDGFDTAYLTKAIRLSTLKALSCN